MERNRALDIAKGIGIFLVIIAHNEDIGWIRGFIYSFHMPLFFILGGYCFRIRTITETLKNGCKRLLTPYVFSCALYLLWYVAFGLKYQSVDMIIRALKCLAFGSGAYHGDVILSQFPTIGMVWFLLALFWCRLVYCIICQYCGKYRYLIGGVVSVVATLIDNYLINLPWTFLPGLSAIMFFMLGNLLREHQETVSAHKSLLIPIGVLSWMAALLWGGTSMVNCRYGCYPFDIVGACGASWLVYRLSCFIDKRNGKISYFLSWVGANSMTILCAHFLEQSTFVWSHLHIPEDWYIILPIKFLYVTGFVFLANRIPYTKELFAIRDYAR